jgi:NADP-reducing hydrogenase subunit HndB
MTMVDRITSPDQLKALAAKAQADIDLRQGRKETQVTVHMGTCGIAAGARGVIAAFMTEMAAAGVGDVSLHQTGCAGLCEKEPMATVTQADGTMHRYGLLDGDKVHAIVQDHLVGGAPVDEYLIKS